MTTVETRVENPLNNSATTVESVGVNDGGMVEVAVDVAMQRDEETMMGHDGDEEINSCEAEDLEDKMLTVALVKSVVDSGNLKTGGDNNETRKRKRPTTANESTEMGNKTTETTAEVTALHQNPVPDPIRNPLTVAEHVTDSSTGNLPEPPRIIVQQGPQPQASANDKIPTRPEVPLMAIPNQPVETIPPPGYTPAIPQPLVQQTTTTAAATKKSTFVPKPATKRGSAVKKKSSRKSTVKSPKGGKKVTLKVPANAMQIKRSDLGGPTSQHAVPNPLLAAVPTKLPILPKANVAIKQDVVQQQQQIQETAPCPLPAPVPCPLPGLSGDQTEQPEAVVSTFASSTTPSTRGRIFSVDLDPSTFDFTTDVVSEYAETRDRTDSIQLPDTAASAPSDLPIFQRERAFSFEVFNFSGDDLLPPPPAPAVHSAQLAGPVIPTVASAPTVPAPAPPPPPLAPEYDIMPPPITTSMRPRGDSIIFDPASFQDGGIHEKNALLKVKTTNPNGPPEGLLADSSLAAPPVEPEPPKQSFSRQPLVATSAGYAMEMAAASSHQQQPGAAVPSSEIATLPSALSSSACDAATAASSSPATFQMELLNKDGRIGIYLPEERRQRIARFHSKRKMRIWRKRIKYDCRKKLADSRPRIKGRFVKRSDMDDA